MFHFFEAITNNKGDALIGYYVRCVDDAGNGASLYADSSLTPIVSVSGLANAARVDSDGNASFYVAVGDYRLDIYATDGTTLVRSIEDYPMSSDADVAQQAEDAAAEAAASATEAQSYLESLTDLPTNGLTLTANTRAALKLLDTSTNLPAIFDGCVWETVAYADVSAYVTLDTQEGIYCRSTFDTAKVWQRRFKGDADATWFGMATTASASDNVTAIRAALATLKAQALVGSGYNTGSFGLHIPQGSYDLNAEITIDHALQVYGDYSSSGGGTELRWTSNTNGFKTHGDVGHANGCHIRNFVLTGSNAGSMGTCHAISADGFTHVSDCYIHQWMGSAIYATGAPPEGGDAAQWTNILADECDWIVYVQGDNSGCIGKNLGTGNNRLGGIFDGSGIGNTWFPGVINGCGNIAGYATHCVYSSKGYSVAYGQEVWCSTNAPSGTTAHNQGWLYDASIAAAVSATAPAWTSGLTWYFGSPICIQPDDLNIQSVVCGGYVETGLNAMIVNVATTLIRGEWLCSVYYNPSAGTCVNASFMRGNGTQMQFNNAIKTNGPTENAFYNTDHVFGPTDGAQTLNVTWQNTATYSIHNYTCGGVYAGRHYVANTTGITFEFDLHTFNTKGSVALADLSSSGLNLASSIPLKINGTTAIDSSRNGSFVNASATGTLGHATGAGGAVTQATNRTTGVTLNKACGAITLVSAAGSTSYQSFTVTNSTVAATDTIRVVQKSGTDKHAIWVTAVGAGSFEITYATLSGTTTEQPVFNFSVIKAVTS